MSQVQWRLLLLWCEFCCCPNEDLAVIQVQHTRQFAELPMYFSSKTIFQFCVSPEMLQFQSKKCYSFPELWYDILKACWKLLTSVWWFCCPKGKLRGCWEECHLGPLSDPFYFHCSWFWIIGNWLMATRGRQTPQYLQKHKRIAMSCNLTHMCSVFCNLCTILNNISICCEPGSTNITQANPVQHVSVRPSELLLPQQSVLQNSFTLSPLK